MSERPYQPFYKPYGMTDEEYEYETQIAADKLAQWEAEQHEQEMIEKEIEKQKDSNLLDAQVIKQTADAIKELLQLAIKSHTYCEDGWYSCAKAEGGCYNDSVPEDECGCGADEHNKRVIELKNILMNDSRLSL